MKRIAITTLNLIFLVMLSACGNKEQAATPSATNPTVTAAVAQDESSPVTAPTAARDTSGIKNQRNARCARLALERRH